MKTASLSQVIESLRIECDLQPEVHSIEVAKAWELIAHIDLVPVTEVNVDADESILMEWAVQFLSDRDHGQTVAVSLSGFDVKGWVRITVGGDMASVARLWLASPERELVVLDESLRLLIGITAEEYTYNGYRLGI